MMRNGSMPALSGSLLNTIIAGAAIAASGGLAACSGAAPGQRAVVGEPAWTATARAPAGTPASDAPSAAVTSNILRQDYVGSKACEPCHGEIYAAWARSPMHQMTRLPDSARIRAPFDGSEFHFKNDRARFESEGGAHFIRVASAGAGTHVYRVTKVIGGRYREDFAGVEVPDEGTASAAVASAAKGELILPVSFVFQPPSFRLKGYSVMVGERPGLRAGGVWNQTCVFCHNTNPYFDSTWGELYGPGAPGYQGEVVDRLLPPARRFSFEITDEAALARALENELAVLGDEPPRGVGVGAGAEARRALLGASMHAMRRDLTPAHFVEVGIGCESCHGGSREHIEERPRAARLRAAQRVPARAPAGRRRRADARRGDQPHLRALPPGAVLALPVHLGGRRPARRAGRRARRQLDHLGRGARLPARRLRAPDGVHHLPRSARRGSARQARGAADARRQPRLHDLPRALRRAEALRAHAHHDPAGAGGACLACHMPRKNMGLGYALTRYHRIGSPTDAARVERRSAARVRALPRRPQRRDPGRRHGAAVGQALRSRRRWRGSTAATLDVNALVATVEHGKPHEQAPAMAVLGEKRVGAALAPIARQLLNPIPLVRFYARRAVDAIRGAPCAVDLDRTTAEIEAAARRCVPAAWPASAVTPTAAPPSRAGAASEETDDD